MNFKRALYIVVALFLTNSAIAQDDLFDLMETDSTEEVAGVYTPFMSTRIINMQSTEGIAKGTWSFIIAHRFGAINGGWRELYGLDQSSIRFGFEFGLSNWLTVGVGRSSFEKTYDGFIKASLLKQGKKGSPVNLTLYTTTAVNSLENQDTTIDYYFSNRVSYVHQLLVSRKFGKRLILQLTPSLVHKNLVENKADHNDQYVVGFGGKYKLSDTYYLTGEYHYVTNPNASEDYDNSLSLGVDIVTGGGHIFSLHLTNSNLGMFERAFLTETTGTWGNGDIHMGFNVNREFHLFDPKPKKKVDVDVAAWH